MNMKMSIFQYNLFITLLHKMAMKVLVFCIYHYINDVSC
uniref:Uncharacterized protein n=1 Tax=Arundo donax TaxID=35708 RepID=A0A0A9EDQ4_ARUDO